MNSLKKLFDPIRECFVEALPEEIVRQKLLNKMILELGFPKGLIAVEKELDTLPYLQGGVLNKRRADIICFAKNIHPKHELYPLLMIECKAVKITKETLNQLKGYNHFVKALFISMANDEEIKTLWYNAKNKNYDMVDFLPSFHEMIKSIEKQ